MSHIVKFKMAGLWNCEYPLVVRRIAGIVGEYNLSALHLLKSHERIMAFFPQLLKIEVQENVNADSNRLSELDSKRDMLYNTIHGVAREFKRVHFMAESQYAETVLAVLKKHGTNITKANYTAETNRLSDLGDDVMSQPKVIEALEALSLAPLATLLGEVNKEFENVFMQRNRQQAEVEHTDVRAIRLACDKAVTLLWAAIEHNIAEYGIADYQPLLNAVNNLNSYYKQRLAARATRRRNKEDVSSEEPIIPQE